MIDVKRILKALRILNTSDQTKSIELTVTDSASSNTNTILQSSQTANRTLNLPDANDTLVARTTTDTLTNKTIVVANNTVTTAASGNLTSTELNNALSELQTDIDTRATSVDLQAHINDTTDAHDASAISVVPTGNLAADDVQEALVELQNDIDTRTLETDFQAHLTDTVDAHDASAISVVPTGNLAADDAQEALVELQTDVDGRATIALDNLAGVTNVNSSINPSAAEDGNLTLGIVGRSWASVASNLFQAENNLQLTSNNGDVEINADGGAQDLVVTSSQSLLSLPQATDPSLPITGGVYYNNADNKYKYYDGTAWKALGSDAGSGVKNFIENGDAEDSVINNFTTYNDGAVTRPIDGTGGTPTISNVTRSTSSPVLDGEASWRFVKLASNVQGQGWSVPFTIQDGHQAKSIKIRALYQVVSGTFTAGSKTSDSDLIVYLYDVTNSQLIEPSNFKFLSNSSTISDIFEGEFQTSATGTSYRLIFHIASNTTNAWELVFDEINVSPNNYIFGSPVSDYSAYTPTLSNNTGVSSNTAYYRRVGDNIEVNGRVLFNNTGAGAEFTVSLPSGMSIDSAKTATTMDETSFGIFQFKDNGVSFRTGNVVYASATSVRFNLDSSTQSILGTGLTSGDTLNYIFKVPVAGLSSSVQMSDRADTRVLTVRASGSSSTVTASHSKITYSTKTFDTHNAYSSGTFTVPVQGFYRVKASIQLLYSSASGINNNINIYKNGVNYSTEQINQFGTTTNVYMSVTDTVECRAGDTIEIYASCSGSGISINDVGAVTNLSIERVTGPSAIAASETVKARYATGAGQSISAATTTIIDYGTKSYDSHNSVTTGASWKFTAPIAGTYSINACIYTGSPSWVAGASIEFLLYKNGTLYSALDAERPHENMSRRFFLNGATTVELVAGDYIDIRHVADQAHSLNADARFNYIDISKIGL